MRDQFDCNYISQLLHTESITIYVNVPFTIEWEQQELDETEKRINWPFFILNLNSEKEDWEEKNWILLPIFTVINTTLIAL